MMDVNPEFNTSNLPDTIKYGPKGIDIVSLIDLRQRGLSVAQIGKLVGCSDANVAKRLAKLNGSIDRTHKYRKNRSLVYATLQERIIQRVSDTDIAKAKLIDKVKAISFLHNQERLEDGLSTANIAYADMVKAQRHATDEMAAIEAQYGVPDNVQDADIINDNVQK